MENKELSIVSNCTQIQGKLNVIDEAHVYGSIKGDVTGSEGSTVIIKKNGLIDGTLKADFIIVEGTFQGELTATQSLTVAKHGKVFGNLATHQLNVEHGSLIEAKIRMI